MTTDCPRGDWKTRAGVHAPADRRAGERASADLLGQVSPLIVWVSWCVPCRTENPHLVELAEAGTVPIHGINFKDEPEQTLTFLKEFGDPFTRVAADRSGRVAIGWGVYGLPETFVIDAEGRIAYKHVGPFDRRSLEDEILPVVRRLQAERVHELSNGRPDDSG